MESCIGKTCPYCRTAITEGEPVTVCPACGIPHHSECWEENGGCTTFGCSAHRYVPQGTNPTGVCASCGGPLGDGQAFCPKCGAPKQVPRPGFCGNCGAALEPGFRFCNSCGRQIL